MISGQKLREFREASGVRPAQVADAAGWPRQRSYQIERAADVGKEVAETFVNAVVATRDRHPSPGSAEPAVRYTLEVKLYIGGGGPMGSSHENPLISGRNDDGSLRPW